MKTRLILIMAGLLAVARPVSARILSTKPPPSETWSPLWALTVGGGFEFETDRERSEYDFPLLLEYNLTKTVRASVEPTFVYIDSKSQDVRSVGGWGDLETSLQWEFLRERRYRPALTTEGIIRWPTANDPDLGDPGRDYSLGLIASKDFVYVDVDLGLHYTSVGDPEAQDNFEVTVAGEWPLNHRLSVLTESVTTIETGRCGRTETEGTAGLAWRVNSFLKLEFGGTLRSDGTWQALFAWEWNFAGED
jgi:hypothetical protein